MKTSNVYVPLDWNEAEKSGRRLRAWEFIPSDSDPSKFCTQPKETIYVKLGENPFDLIEAMVPKDEMSKTWIIIEEPVLEQARKIPGIYHFDRIINYPEVFNFNSYHFERAKVIHLNHISGFNNWKIICAWIGKDDTSFTIPVPDNPDKIVRVVME